MIEWNVRSSGARDGLSRRSFFKASAVLGGGLVLGWFGPGSPRTAQAAEANAIYTPNAFIHIAPDNTVTVAVNRAELGQGIATGLPMVIAEELDADWSLVRSELAPAADVYKDPVRGHQMTGGSGSIKRSFAQYREIGARARAMLLAAAAQRWNVKPGQCRTARSMVFGPAGQKASYGSLAEAAMRLPVPEQVALKDPSEFKLIGQPTRRLDARAKSSGRQVYGMDFKPAGSKVAVVARPPVFGGKVARFDAAKALAVKGVRAVLPVPTDRGGNGLAVIADGYWPAKQGRDALDVQWDTAGVEKVDTAQLFARLAAVSGQPGGAAMSADIRPLAQASKRISAVYTFPYLAHAPMEPLNCVVDLGPDHCEIWAGSQYQTIDQNHAAQVLGLDPARVTFHTMMAGGGFGRRAVPSSDYIVEAVQVAKAWRASGQSGPLKVIWSREDDLHGGYYRPAHLHRAEIGLNADGRIVAWDHVIAGQSILMGTQYEKFVQGGVDGTMVEGMGRPYELPINLTTHIVQANVPVLWWRSVGSTHTAFVMETLIDEAAQLAGIDPVAYRRQLIPPDKLRHHAALDLAVAKSGYGKRTLPNGHAWGVAMHEAFDSIVVYVVEASVQDGVPRLHRATAAVHCNLAVNPMSIEAQVQGSVLMAVGTTLPGAAITLRNGIVEQDNFHAYTVARMPDMPHVEVHIVPSADAPTGMGEPGFPPLAPAYANAIARLTGKRLRSLPFYLKEA
ncbi:xanthine dehydrogenase family protein molybdopterin-binding subunit [Massilia endophytica]|uniref:xanthine dehydrogenase family protein molybdopterin-binding subunit n=1 Tax=Massilia endophytica TaxID=2899220 RepID=UPI001E3F2FBD|nr:xanthine dehydrogenase family protein molybdopterin-binding subunit [Massilia endophytica]UGQ44574.1 xanthine dehydrogenase family protein molybdopterin-binding subunit [Massilia endophytica]